MNGETLNKVKAYYKKLKEKYIEDNIKAIENNIKIREPEGTDYDSMEFYYEEMPYIFVQATAMFDYDGKPVDGYTGDSEWADTALFFVDDVACEFDDLDD